MKQKLYSESTDVNKGEGDVTNHAMRRKWRVQKLSDTNSYKKRRENE